MNAESAHKLREPFPPELIGKLPKGGTMLDFVGHAAVTDRLLQADPDWSWEPMARMEDGSPIVVTDPKMLSAGSTMGLWIRLTVCGVTRPGFGDGKNIKECISDALRNAAMRFGVALDLWSKQDLDSGHTNGAVDRHVTSETAGAEKPSADRAMSPEETKRLAELDAWIVKAAEKHGKKPDDVQAQILFSYSASRLEELTGVQVIEATRKLRTWHENAGAAA